MRRFFDRAFERFTMRKPVHAARPSSTFLAAALLSTFSFAIARGDIEVSPRALDFGEAGHGERIRRTLTLRNTGDEPIRIRSARASCGCTTLERSIDGQAIPPGTSLEVGVVMSSGTAIGSLEKHLDIELGDGRRVRVATSLRVFPDIRFPDPIPPFEGEVRGAKCVRTVDVLSRSEKGDFELAVERIVTGLGSAARKDDGFEARVERISGGRRIIVTLLPTRAEGRFAGTIEARLDGKPFHLPISGEMFRSIRISPRDLQFGRVETGAAAKLPSVTAELISIDGKAFEILETKVELKRGAAGVEWRPSVRKLDDGLRHEVLLSLVPPASAPAGGFYGTLRIKTSHPEKPVLELGIYGFFPATRPADRAADRARNGERSPP